ncbi:DUF308 domain-containing protein [Salinarchaeum sp. IM2453]|uniref:DUF7344 domain-containing protein n=1 Tax=Salinarchaeum sp. IM2453 TaxID=2862870 RepID=UPI001C82B07C|nr:DUF308 domain-containing protein [Salinarchaeum sp. IM2453]QZA88484.1 DUF308 domain-containing protein [Salinarchaeum sp. IM2453]
MSAGEVQPGGTSPELTDEDIFDVLSNQRRRHAVHTLRQTETDQIEIGDLAEEIAAIENDTTVEDISYDQRKRVYTSLQQSHLPKMDDAGVVDFNKDRGTIEPTPAMEDVEIYLDVVRGREIPWSEYYLGLTAVSAALVTAHWIGAWPIAVIPEVGVMLFIVIAFAVSSVAHTYFSKQMKIGSDGNPPDEE